MNTKIRIWLLLFITLTVTSLAIGSENEFLLIGSIGTSLSRPFDINDEVPNYGYPLSISYRPGINESGFVGLKRKQFAFLTGFGFKQLNFNAKTWSLAEARLRYIYCPVKLRYYFGSERRFFVSLGAEFARLLDDTNTEKMDNRGWYCPSSRDFPVYLWFQQNQFFLTMDAGRKLTDNMFLTCELTMNPNRVDVDLSKDEGWCPGGFYFTKILGEFRVGLEYYFIH